MRPALLAVALLVASGFTACRCQAAPPSAAAPAAVPSAQVPAAQREVVEPIFRRGLKGGWMDFGWSERTVRDGAPVTVDLSGYGGWIAAKFGTPATFSGLSFRLKADGGVAGVNAFLKGNAGAFPVVELRPEHVVEARDGWQHVFVTMAELNPSEAPFDQVVFMGRGGGKLAGVQLDDVGLTRPDPSLAAGGRKASAPAQAVEMAVDCAAATRPISPLVYGIAFDPAKLQETHWQELGATTRRWGGNPSTRYNWKLGNAWNTASDWYFENVNYTGRADYSWEHFLRENAAQGMQTALTLPTIGWVAKDTTSVAFPRSRFPQQRSFDNWRPEAGDGHGPDGKPLPPPAPTQTSVEAPPEFVADWVKAIRKGDGAGRRVQLYILDNEPMIWGTTHRDVRGEQPLTYDELLERTVKYASAVRRADPGGRIAGPAEWGWSNYLYSEKDLRAGHRLRPDRRAHGDVPLVEWYLRKLREHKERTGEQLIDVLDLHYYPQGQGLAPDGGGTDLATSLRRIRSTRSLWDPTYEDESWIEDTVMLVPRMQKWIADNHPGLGTMIGEYNFGAFAHMSGALAQAEALGRFGQTGLTAAYLWTYPPKNSPVAWAFRAFRNYDGQGARFGDVSVQTAGGKAAETALFASRDEANKRLVLVALNHLPDRPVDARVALKACGAGAGPVRAFRYAGGARGLEPLQGADAPAPKDGALRAQLPPWSITVYELPLGGGP